MPDVVIIGAGCAGLTAAVYVERAGYHAVVIEKYYYGGQIAITNEIENYPGIEKITGPNLSSKIFDQAVQLGAEIKYETVIKVDVQENGKTVITDQNHYNTKALIIANGVIRKKLHIKGEDEFTGLGVSYCATCDGAFFRDKETAVVGGGNTALEDALFLSKICKTVYLIHRRDSFRGEQYLVSRIAHTQNIQILYDTEPEEIIGNDQVTGICLRDKKQGKKYLLPVHGVFVAIGLKPDNAMFANTLQLDASGYFDTDETCATNIPGVLVAGDNRKKILRQIVTAAADGAVAGYQAANYLNAFPFS